MARGWESKSVEDQQAEATAERSQPRKRLTTEQIARRRQIQALELSRHNVQQQLLSVQNPRHREMLQRALADLDAQVSKFSKPDR